MFLLSGTLVSNEVHLKYWGIKTFRRISIKRVLGLMLPYIVSLADYLTSTLPSQK